MWGGEGPQESEDGEGSKYRGGLGRISLEVHLASWNGGRQVQNQSLGKLSRASRQTI